MRYKSYFELLHHRVGDPFHFGVEREDVDGGLRRRVGDVMRLRAELFALLKGFLRLQHERHEMRLGRRHGRKQVPSAFNSIDLEALWDFDDDYSTEYNHT